MRRSKKAVFSNQLLSCLECTFYLIDERDDSCLGHFFKKKYFFFYWEAFCWQSLSHGKFYHVYLENLKLNIQRKHKITLTEHNQLPQSSLGHVIVAVAGRKKTPWGTTLWKFVFIESIINGNKTHTMTLRDS